MAWRIEGQYMETCNCSFLCPCITSNLRARPTEGECKAALAMQIERGAKDGVTLDGLAFIVVLRTPQAMAEGDWTLGVIIDEKATEQQAAAVSAIASGEVGGPMMALAALTARKAGVERRTIRFARDGLSRGVTAGDLVDQACDGVPSRSRPGEPLVIDNAGHPANTRLALARARSSRIHAFGIDWDDASGTRNGHFAPFAWSA